MTEHFGQVLYHGYFYKRLTELEDEQSSIIRAMRTKTGLLALCDRIRAIEGEKQVLLKFYEDFNPFFNTH